VSPLAGIAPALIARARADQVGELYAGWHRTSLSMLVGAGLLCSAMWGQASPSVMALWVALIVVNQLWRGVLARAWHRAQPGLAAAPRWGRYWAIGSTFGGGLWGIAAVTMYPDSPPHQALLIVCLFGVVLGGLNLTAVYKPSFYGFVVPALVPLILREALVADHVHAFTALVMSVVLGFVLAFGHHLNDVLTRSLAIRYENVDLINGLKSQTRAAHEARTAAEAANRAKSQLLAAASHDLRQPLHALGLYTAALAARTREAPWQSLVSNVQNAVHALEAQFAQLLDLSQLEAGAHTPERSRVALAPLFARVAAEFRPQAVAKGLVLRCAATRLAVDSDAALLERMVRNLVANAVHYTSRGGILIGGRRRGALVSVVIMDTGVGIAPEHGDRIFEEFYQVRRGGKSTAAPAGMGLGLAIVRRLAQLLSHDVTVASRLGTGSCFRIDAPRAADVVHAFAGAAPAVAAAGRASLHGTLVAVVDDDPAAIDAMTELFAIWGANVVGGRDAQTLLAALGRWARYPDLVVADLRLSNGASGVTTVRALRDELGFAVPALIVSGDTSAAAERAARSAGLTLLPKPVVANVLEAVATALVARAVPRAA
jgi:signal transduction histidine kinase/CheY-like chemotaxis protein